MKPQRFHLTRARASLAAAALILVACSPGGDEREGRSGTASASPTSGTIAASSTDDSPYAFERPVAAFELSDELMEISGLAVVGDGRLAAVQDEDGILFLLDAATGSITGRIAFGDGGDYEGVELVDDRIFVLRSNGNLIELSGWQEDRIESISYKTGLKASNDTEGLAYDAAGGRLLVVTKEDPGKGLDEDRHRGIYAFDLGTGELSKDAALVIDLDQIRSALPGLKAFKPSALAVHPESGDVYVLSSTEQALVALDDSGRVRHAWKLSPEQFEQPEGLAFLPDGDLLISSEGVAGPAMLFRFAMQR